MQSITHTHTHKDNANTLLFRSHSKRTEETASLIAGLRDWERHDRNASKPQPFAWLSSKAI